MRKKSVMPSAGMLDETDVDADADSVIGDADSEDGQALQCFARALTIRCRSLLFPAKAQIVLNVLDNPNCNRSKAYTFAALRSQPDSQCTYRHEPGGLKMLSNGEKTPRLYRRETSYIMHQSMYSISKEGAAWANTQYLSLVVAAGMNIMTCEIATPWQALDSTNGKSVWWWNEDDDDWFFASEPEDWMQFTDPNNGQPH